jgi:hypothetical protein
MPLYKYQCQVCGKELRRICDAQEALTPPECCSKVAVRTPSGASSRCTEIIDNGIMTKKIERLVDAERLFKERHEANIKKLTDR